MSFFDRIDEFFFGVELAIEEFIDFSHDMNEISKGIGKTVVESAHELGEITVHQIKGEDLTTSYEVRDKAERIVDESERAHRDALSNCHEAVAEAQKRAETVSALRETVYSHIGKALHVELTPLPKAIDITRHYPDQPELDNFSFDLGTFLCSASMRMSAAEDYLQSAEEYRTEVNQKIVEYEQIRRLAEKAAGYEEEELELLRAIDVGYEQFSQSKLSESGKILREITELFLQEVSEHNNQHYQQLLKKLRNIID